MLSEASKMMQGYRAGCRDREANSDPVCNRDRGLAYSVGYDRGIRGDVINPKDPARFQADLLRDVAGSMARISGRIQELEKSLNFLGGRLIEAITITDRVSQ